MTTNRTRLADLAAPLREAGLDRVTVSRDSHLRHRFVEMTRRVAPIKINCVVIKGRAISSVTEAFCDVCKRVRVTADVQLRACLFALEETDLRTPMLAGATDAELEGLIRKTVLRKWAGLRINHPDFVRPSRSMSQSGG